MQEQKPYQQDVIELNLADLFWSLLRHWRSILVVMLAAAVMLGAYTFYKGYKDLNDPDVVQKRTEDYEKAMKTYQTNKENQEKKLANLQKEQKQQEFYRENAVMLRFDPDNVYVIDTTYYVDANYEIMPELYYQNPNYTSVITNRYKSAVDRILPWDLVSTPEEPDLTARNPVSGNSKKLVNTSVDAGNGILNITIYGDTEERAEQIYNKVKETLDAQGELLNQLIGENTIGILYEERYADIDSSFETLQTNFENKVKSTADAIESTTKALEDLKEPENEIPSMKGTVMASVKKAVIGLLAGLFAAAFFWLLKTVLQNRVNSTEEVSRRYAAPVLGVVSGETKKQNKLDTYLAGKLGVQLKQPAEDAAKYIASNLDLYAKGAEKLLLVGTCGQQKLEQLRDQLAPLLDGVEVGVGGNVNTSPAAVKELTGKQAVLCVENWLKSPHKEIAHELQAVKASGNENVGFVILA